MKILISIIMMISDCKIKVKNVILIEALNKIFDKNHVILSNFSDKIAADQKTVFSSKNMIITKKIIFVLNAVIQIIQLKTVNSHSTQITVFQNMIKKVH